MMSTTSSRSIICFVLVFNWIRAVVSKGGATRGAAVGGGQVCTDCTVGNYTTEEMGVALIVLSIILCIFFAVCTCQCYQKIVREFCKKSRPHFEKEPMPCAPYFRDAANNA